jgi:hypothetical protein
MKRWLVGIVIAGGVAFIGWLIVRNIVWETTTVRTPPSTEVRTNPFYSAQHFVDSLGATSEWRHTLGSNPPTTAVIVLRNWHWGVIESRRKQLEDWVKAGGRLVVDHSLIDDDHQFRGFSGISVVYPGSEDAEDNDDDAATDDDTANDDAASKEPDDAPSKDDRSKRSESPVADDSPIDRLFETTGACGTLHRGDGEGGLPARKSYEICHLNPVVSLNTTWSPLWSLRDEDEALQAVRVRVGKGTVTMLNAEPFGNLALTQRQHGLLLADVLQLRRGDRIVFLSEEERDSLLRLTWIYGWPAVVLTLVLIAVGLWRAGARFGPLVAIPDLARRSIAEQIRGTGRFTLRVGGGSSLHAAMVRALHEAAQRRISGYHSLSQPEKLAAIAKLASIDADALAETVNYTGARRAGDLRNAVMVLEFARRTVLDTKATGAKSHSHTK